jgi:hypothetical protein
MSNNHQSWNELAWNKWRSEVYCMSEIEHEHQHQHLSTYREFTDALTEVLAENAVGPARRGRLARARAAVKKHPEYSEPGYLQAMEAAFNNWEALHKGRPVN